MAHGYDNRHKPLCLRSDGWDVVPRAVKVTHRERRRDSGTATAEPRQVRRSEEKQLEILYRSYDGSGAPLDTRSRSVSGKWGCRIVF
jgi:hypothetical protein